MVGLLKGELLKVKRKKVLLVVFCIQMLALLWLFGVMSQSNKAFYNWNALISQLSIINGLFLPILIAMITSRIVDFENKGNTWKLLFAMPIPRLSIYMLKIICSILFLGFANIIAYIGVICIGKMLHFVDSIPIILLWKYSFFTLIGSMPMVILQLWISLSVKNQVFALAAGVIGTFLGYFSQMFPWSKLMIWGYPSLTSPISWTFSEGHVVYFSNTEVSTNLLISLGVTALLIGCSCIQMMRKDIH
ncbi:ABC transporter permease [Bacillus sp. NPDC094106]|uniref:ABC transporter permease n=1 Tax=Bacillus sp. NPDC094106 TaxID=3363949 RepID=UPI003829C934